MTTFAELVVKVSNNYNQATQDSAKFEQQTAKTERAATAFGNSSIILSQKVKTALIAEDAARLESHRKQIEIFTQQLAQLEQMKRVEERVTQEHQNQLNIRLAAQQAAIDKQISLSNEGNARLLATVRETNARILAEELAQVEKINSLKSQAMMGVSQGNAAFQTPASGSSYMAGLSSQVNPKILADQAAQAEKIKQFENAIKQSNSAILSNNAQQYRAQEEQLSASLTKQAEKIKQFQNTIKESNSAIITTNAQQYRQQEQQLHDSLAKRLSDQKAHNAEMLKHQNAANQTPAKGSSYMVGLSPNANTTGFTGPTITPAQLAANKADSERIKQIEIRNAKINQMESLLSQTSIQILSQNARQYRLIEENKTKTIETEINKRKQFELLLNSTGNQILSQNARQYRAQEEQLRESLEKRKALYKNFTATMNSNPVAIQTSQLTGSAGMIAGMSRSGQLAAQTAFVGPTITPAQLAASQAYAAQLAQRTALYTNMTAAMSRSNQTSESSRIMINGMTASYRAQQERLQSINATYNDHINRLTMTRQEYHALQLAQQGLNQQQIQHIQSLTDYSTGHTMLQRVLTKTFAIMTAMAAYRGLSFILGVPGDILELNKDMELLKIRLEALTGSALNAKVAFEDLVSLDFKTPFDIKELTKSFLILKNYGINPTERVMTALTDTISKFGGTSENMVGVSTQLGQAWSKNKLQLQDMRVIIENGVPIISLLAKTLNTNNEEILRMSKEGSITTEIMSKLFDTMERESAGASAKMMNSLSGSLSNVHSAWIQLVDALLEDKSESAIRHIFEVWSTILMDWKDSITGVTDPTKELMKNWSDLADVRSKMETAKSIPLHNLIPGFTDIELKAEEKRLLSEQDRILDNMEKAVKARSKNNEESVTELASNQALLRQEEAKQTALDKFYEKSLSLDDKYNASVVKNTNSSIEVQIAKLKDATETKIKSYELDIENNKAAFKNKEQTEKETYLIQMDYISKIRAVKLNEIDELAKLENSKIQDTADNHKKIYDAILMYETHRSGPYKGGAVNPTTHALGEGQVLPSTAMDPGLQGVKALEVVRAKGKEFFKGSIKDIQQFVRDHEVVLRDFGESYYNGLVRKLGSHVKAINAYGEPTPEYLKGVLSIYEKMDGSVEKQNQSTIKQMDLEKQRSEIITESAKMELQAKQDYNEETTKTQKLLESEKAKINDLRDAEIDRYNKATMSESQYYIEKLKHTEKSNGVLLSKSDISGISSLHDKADIAEKTKKTYDDELKFMETYGLKIDEVKSKYQDMGSVIDAVFKSSQGSLGTLIGSLDSMTKGLIKNQDESVKLFAEKKRIDDFKPKTKEDAEKNDKARLRNEKEYQNLQQDTFDKYINGTAIVGNALASMIDDKKEAEKAQQAIALVTLGIQAVQAIVTQGQGDPYTAFARIAAMAAIVGAMVSSVGGDVPVNNVGATAPTPDTGTVLGDSTAPSESIDKTYQLLKDIHASEYVELQGINSGVSALASGINNTVTKLFQTGGLKEITLGKYNTGLGNKIQIGFGGVNADPILNFILKGIFGTIKKEIVGGGILTNATGLNNPNITGQQYTTIQTTKKSWFSKKVTFSEELSALDPEITSSLTKIFQSISSTTKALASTLFKQSGIDVSENIKKYIIPSLHIELFGLSGEQAAKKLSSVISATTDKMATKIFGSVLGKYQQLGEGMLQTVVRITAEIAVVTEALALSGLKLDKDKIIAGSDAIVQAAGSIAEFQAQVTSYVDKFYNDSEKQAQALKLLNGQLNVLGLTLPTTKEGYRKLIESLNINNKKDEERYSLLIKLSGAADTYYSLLEQQISSYADAVTKAKDDLSTAYKTESDAITEAINKADAFAKSMTTFKDSLVLGDLSTKSPEQKYAEARTQFEANQSAIMQGAGSTVDSKAAYETAISNMQSKANAFLTESKNFNASGEGYVKDYQQVLAAIEANANLANNTKTLAEQQLDVLKESVTGFIDLNTSVLSVVDALKALADATKAQSDYVNKLALDDSTAKATLHQAKMDAYSKNDPSWNKNVKWEQLPLVNAVYGSFTDALSADDWSSRASIVDAMLKDLNAQEQGKKAKHDFQYYLDQASKIDGSHYDGLNNVPFDGYRAELHKGERVLTAKQVTNDGAISQEIVAELKALREEVAKQKDNSAELIELRALVRLQSASAQAQIDRLDKIGTGISSIERKARLEAAV